MKYWCHSKARNEQEAEGDVHAPIHVEHVRTNCEESVQVNFNPAYTAMKLQHESSASVAPTHTNRMANEGGVQDRMYESFHATGSTTFYDYISTTEYI